MAERMYLAADLGASSGRLVVGRFDGQRVSLEEVHRFENGPVNVGGSLYWDLLGQWQQVQLGMRAAAARFGSSIRSVGVDTWGVDFALLGRGGVLLGNPSHYRDRRTDGFPQRAFATVSREDIFAATGLQFLQFNTLYQLLAMQEAKSPLLDVAESLLMMPDAFHWLMTGVKANEFTNATTTQFYDPVRQDWARELLGRFGLPTSLLGEVVSPGTDLGPLLPHVAAETGLHETRVVLPGTHDTASAVMAVPVEAGGGPWAYISSGTWSLMGIESPTPVVNDACRRYNFTNEGGVGRTIRLLKNITGLWLVQECRRIWSQGGREYSWTELTRLAAAASPLASFIDPDDGAFLAPGDMPEAIREYCRRTNQPVPAEEGAVIRCALESIALKSRLVLTWIESLTGQAIETIHIVGGGAQNRELCQATADACGKRVLAGPAEATATGNVMMQAVAAGDVGSIAEAREVIRRSSSVEEYEPQNAAAWDDAFGRFRAVVGA